MRETSFYYFLSAADLEACVQLLPPLKEKKKFGEKDSDFLGKGPLAYATPLCKRSHTQITKRNCASLLVRL